MDASKATCTVTESWVPETDHGASGRVDGTVSVRYSRSWRGKREISAVKGKTLAARIGHDPASGNLWSEIQIDITKAAEALGRVKLEHELAAAPAPLLGVTSTP